MTCPCPLPTDSSGTPPGGAVGVDRYLPDLGRLWALTRGSPNVCVALLDGAIDVQHACFDNANLKQLNNHVPGGRGGLPLLHGTHVASLVFGQHSSPFRGVAPSCRGVVIPVFDERDDGSLVPCSQLDLARAISLAVAVGANVINISGGRNDPSGQPEPVLSRALELCAAQGILVVASAGNDGCRCLHVPAAAPSVLAVGAMDEAGQPWADSNWGDAYLSHGLLAPGQNVLGAVPGGGLAAFSGTSVAAAIVSGVAALLISVLDALGHPLDTSRVRQALLQGASGCHDSALDDCRRLLGGRLNITNSLSLLLQGDTTTMFAETAPRQNPAPGAPRNAAEPRLAYALGLIDYDFGTEARRDAFVQRGVANPADREAMLDHLQKHPRDCLGMTWTLVHEATPIYAIQPSGPFAADIYSELRELLKSQLKEYVSRVALPGVLHGSAHLMSGQQVPVIHPDPRGMCSWSTSALIQEVLGPCPEPGDQREEYLRQSDEIANFLDRIYYELSNLGVAPQERALNYAATNLYQVATVYKDAVRKDLKLDKIDVERSSVCRPGSECWDVKLTLFDPGQRQERAKEMYRLTVDVSETIPVTVGKLRHWACY